MEKIVQKFNIEGMSCAACSASIEKVVGKIAGVTKAQVNLLKKVLNCEYDGNIVTISQITDAVANAGFSATPQGENLQAVSNVGERGGYTNIKTRLIVSLSFLVVLMYISMGHMIGLPLPPFMHGTKNGVAFSLTQMLLTLPILYVNRKFFFSGFKALFRSPNMDTLVAIGSAAAFLYGVFAIYMIGYGVASGNLEVAARYGENLYFESAAMILTLVTVGKLLEERSKNRTSSAINKLSNLAPKMAVVERNGIEVEISSQELQVGDIIIVRSGESIAADGDVIYGEAAVNQAAITGESMSVSLTAGSQAICATVVETGYIKVKAANVGSQTMLAKIIELVENASATKAPISRLADKVSGIFVPIVMAIALVTIVVWLILGATFDAALTYGISVLVISCPCALGLATPVAITVATGKSAASGILIKSGEALELLSRANVVVFDKTGTLTEGQPVVVESQKYSENFLLIAAAMEALSEHPLAKAVVKYAGSTNVVATDYKWLGGKGISARVDGEQYYAGNAKLMEENNIKVPEITFSGIGTTLYFASRTQFLGAMMLADEIKPDSKQLIAELKHRHIKTVMLTGDSSAVAHWVAEQVGVDEVICEVLPAEKEQVISDLMSSGNIVAMVGDGINDSPSLVRANVGIAIGSGTDIAIDSADIILMGDSISDVNKAIRYSKKTLANIKQNLFWAFCYNVIGIPIAAGALYAVGVLLSPMIAAAAMSLSSLFVVLNALRLYTMK